MGVTHFPHGLASFGIPVIGTVFATGNVFFVDNGHSLASDNTSSGGHAVPFSSMDYANGRCTANNGDIVFVMPGHTETVTAAAGLDLDTAGVTWIGVGQGSARPTVNFTTDTGADMDVDAANITMYNFLFTGGVDALTGPIDVNAADFKMIHCETRDVTGQATDFIVTDANADRLLLDGWVHRGAAADGADSAINMIGGDDITIRNFDIYGNFDNGAIESITTANVRISIHDGSIWTEGAEDLAVVLLTGSTGRLGPNIYIRLQDDAANIDECIVGDALHYFDNIYIVNADAEKAMLTPITATTDAIV